MRAAFSTHVLFGLGRICRFARDAGRSGAGWLLAAWLVTGCGGGADTGASAPAESAARPVPISALAATGSPANQRALERLNNVRRAIGVAPLATRDVLVRAAMAHSSYLTLNSAASVEELPTQPAFSGRTAEQRARAAGYTGPVVLEVQFDTSQTSTGQTAAAPLDGLLEAPLQRVRLLAPDLDEAGAVQVGHWLVVTLGRSGQRQSAARPAQAYPFDGQLGVPTHYSVGVEAALFSGLPAVTGPALTLGASSFSTFRYSDVSLTTEGTGQVVPLARPEAGSGRLASLIFFPLRPLTPGTAYVWEVAAEVDGQAGIWRSRFVTAL